MINGDGPLEEVYGPASPDPFDSSTSKLSGGGDASPGSLSQYSSCGGESEFERYGSANSVMGTPSLCSSYGPFNDYVESEFGSLKSLENFSLGGRFGGNLEELKLSASDFDCLKDSVKEEIVKHGSNKLELYGVESSGRNNGLASTRENVNLGSSRRHEISDGVGSGLISALAVGEGSPSTVVNEGDDGCISGLDSVLGLDFSGGQAENEDNETSSRYGHSEEDDDSMYGCGSEDENRKNMFVHKNIQYNRANLENENPLLINSSVAFGSEDWDDFEQETIGATLASLTLDGLQKQKGQELDDVGLSDIEEDVMTEPGSSKQGNELVDNFNCSSVAPVGSQDFDLKQAENVRDIPITICQAQGTNELAKNDGNTSIASSNLPHFFKPDLQYAKDISSCNVVQDAHCTLEHLCCVDVDVFETEQDPFEEKIPVKNIVDCSMERQWISTKCEGIIRDDNSTTLEKKETGNVKVEFYPLSQAANQLCTDQTEYFKNESAQFTEEVELNSTQLMPESRSGKILKSNPISQNLSKKSEDHLEPVKVDKVVLNEFHDEIVNEMEEILLDSNESTGARFQFNRMSQSQLSLPLRDGGSTASTSGTDDAFLLTTQPSRVDWIEVVGAKQKKGDVSLSERLVGVKEYTVYVIRVWSGNDQWEVERRYRDFFTLYRRLKSLFSDHGWALPLPWSSVEKESRKIFGNASPDVVSQRSVLIQKCLRSIINSGYFSTPPTSVLLFLCPQDSIPSPPASPQSVPSSRFSNRGNKPGNVSTLGKTISLIVEIGLLKSIKQLLEAQHYTCAGCHKHFDDGKTPVQDFVQALGWGKPRFCEYTGQLFCSSCHTNETAVLPARVLHYWDFAQYPVSQLAKSYLDSIHEQPMLCVSAVNPFLFSKVPALQHIMNVRKKIGTLLPYVRCPFHRTINKGLGQRRYLLEGNDFFALRDLIDLSKGAFAALPVMVETVSAKILEHITEQCLVCCDVGIPCSARLACNDPSSLIFPFQEGEIERCSSCGSVFHKPCFKKLLNCSCGAVIGQDKTMGVNHTVSRKASDLLGRSSSALSVGLLSGLFSRAKPEKTRDHKDNDTVILMGSLPGTYL